MGILEGKNILVAGVTLDTSIGFHVAKIAQAEGQQWESLRERTSWSRG